MHRRPNLSLISASPLVLLMALGCAHGNYRPVPMPRPVALDSDLAGLKVLAAMPNARIETRVMLAGQFLASHRHWEALTYFEGLSKTDDDPVLLALQGVFMAQVANEVPLLRRVSWVEDALGRLDRAAQSKRPFTRLFLGVVYAAVPKRFGKAESAIRELTWVLENPKAFPLSVSRGVLFGLARAFATLGDGARSADFLQRSGHASLSADAPVFFDQATWTRADGFRFTSPPDLEEVASGVFVASGYDFSDQIFLRTDSGIVAIDASTSPQNARAALEALRATPGLSSARISHVILTHAHQDHVGGLSAFAKPGVEIIAHANFDRVVGNLAQGGDARSFWTGGWNEKIPKPTHLIRNRESIEIGGRALELISTRGGETEDALLILDVETKTLIVGDVLMPYVGAPFVNEGSPRGLIETIRVIRGIEPARLLHGHAPLTQFYTADAMQGLESALSTLARVVKADVRAGLSDATVIEKNVIPESLAHTPSAAIPYLVTRNQFIQRLFHQSQGYWGGEGEGLAPTSRNAWSRALDLLANHSAERFAETSEALLKRGDLALALELAELGGRRYPAHRGLKRLRASALERLRVKYQVMNPFKFIIYSARSGSELPPLADDL